ncbi:DNA repair protein rad52 [Collariella sp. IMI 366227]|nr:DNA repair protein rad52 [Collariella sp. IMI 366227]
MASRKRKADDDEMSVSPVNSPAPSARQLSRPSKKARGGSDMSGRPLPLPRLLETLDNTQLRTVLQKICERHPDIGREVVSGAPRPSVTSALEVLSDYQAKLRAAVPFGQSSSDYTYFRVKQPLAALVDAISDFTPQFLPPVEQQTNVSLQYLDAATKVIHELPDWESQQYRHHKDNAYDEIAGAWAMVITEAAKRGGGFVLHTGGWDQKLARHNQQSGGKMEQAINAMTTEVGWIGPNSNAPPSGGPSDPNSILNQLINGTYGSPVRVGPCIQNIQVDFVEENPQTHRVSVGLSVIVRVTLRDGTFHEDIGYGSTENQKGKSAAFEKAKKEGTTDALKRALRHFGNVLGNCIYDKTYLAKVTKMKVQQPRFDESSLHRHSDFAVKEEGASGTVPTADSFEDFLGELDEADFNMSEEGHPDEVALPNSTETDSNQSIASNRNLNQQGGGNGPMQPPARQLARSASAGTNPPRVPQTPPGPRPPQQFNQNRPPPSPINANQPQNQNQNQNPQSHATPRHQPTTRGPAGESVGFFSARAVKALPEESLASGNLPSKQTTPSTPALNPLHPPHPGIDHTSTKPLSRHLKHVAPVIREDDGNETSTNGSKPPAPPGKLAIAHGGSANANVGPRSDEEDWRAANVESDG